MDFLPHQVTKTIGIQHEMMPRLIIKDPESSEILGPYPLITWGRGFSCVLTDKGSKWIPVKNVKLFRESLNAAPKDSHLTAAPEDPPVIPALEDDTREEDHATRSAATWPVNQPKTNVWVTLANVTGQDTLFLATASPDNPF
ncbi:hypothetical protein Nmel_006486 [Mimus melanotis]